MHRLQHCRQPELADQLDAAHRVNALEEEARELQRWGDKKPDSGVNWAECTPRRRRSAESDQSIRRTGPGYCASC
ncbi:hypothetical protein SynMEDNS5_02129 [Synechococcus sp. MEDNS5]|nr:hypothetical protein SynMEDNS5_02129 [Synechococcus sp. MEDNS5]